MSWKRDPNLPNNYALAERQLESLERSLFKNKTEAKMYNDAIEEYIVKGCARPLSEEELNQDAKPVYYLPHHVVYCPDKPSTQLRVVFDPACKNQGVSLNSFLCKGPCFIRNLLGIILRFLKDPVAFAGDISKMYIQIFLPTFVGVCIAEIQSNWDQTDQNPTDDLRRGLTTEHLEGRWTVGLSFLRRPKEEWSIESVQSVVEEDPEKKKSNLKQIGVVVPVNENLNSIEYSNWQRLLRVTAYCMRFVSNVRKQIRRQPSGDEPCDRPLVPEQIEQAQRYWIVTL